MANDKGDFTVEYHVQAGEVDDPLKAKVDKRLQKLAGGHRDIVGASVAVHLISGANRHQEYQARVVIYRKPSNVAALRKAEAVSSAVLEALDAATRQVREQRERLWERSRGQRNGVERG